MTPGRICIVTPGHLASNPRVVKEASALHDAGHHVTVVAGDVTPLVRPFDEDLLSRVRWRVIRVGRPPVPSRIVHRLAARMARLLPDSALPVGVAVRAHSERAHALGKAAARVAADLYIGHYVAGLSAAAYAARSNGRLLGYDAEDFHVGEPADASGRPLNSLLSELIERSCLPDCTHLTASSPLIAQAYEETYGRQPEVVLNVFPLAEMPAEAIGETEGRTGVLRAYWFSQTIGLDRGLQSFIHAIAKARSRVTLDIRGVSQSGRAETLITLAEQLGVGDRISILPMAPPDKMIELAAPYDVGLSLEPGFGENNRRALGNKIFTYLLAGVPVLLSDTPAQRLLASDLGEAGALFSLQDSAGIATQLDKWAFSGEARLRARSAARERARACYNWDLEKQILIRSVADALGKRSGKNRSVACAS